MDKLCTSNVYKRKNPAARAASTTVNPDLVTEASLDRLELLPTLEELGEGATVLVEVTLDGLEEPEP